MLTGGITLCEGLDGGGDMSAGGDRGAGECRRWRTVRRGVGVAAIRILLTLDLDDPRRAGAVGAMTQRLNEWITSCYLANL